MNRSYDFKDLINAYIATERTDYVHPDFGDYYKRLLSALEKHFDIHLLFDGVRVKANRALWLLFQATVRSYLQITTPEDAFLDASAIEITLDRLGEVSAPINNHRTAIQNLTEANRIAHLDLLYALFNALFGEISTIVTSEVLLESGFDDTQEPQLEDYDDYR